MKRNFLLLLLLTLLPVAGWADLVFKAGSDATAESQAIDPTKEVVLTTADPMVAVTAWTTQRLRYYTVTAAEEHDWVLFTYYTNAREAHYVPNSNNQNAQGALLASATNYSWILLYSATGEDNDWADVTSTIQKSGANIYITTPGYYKISVTYVAGTSGNGSTWDNGSLYTLNDPTTIESAPIHVVKAPEAITSDIELEITPVDGKKFYYQTPEEAFIPDATWFTTNKDYVNANSDLKNAIANMLKVNEAKMLSTASVGVQDYSLVLKDEYDSEQGLNIIPIPGTEYNYIIMPAHYGKINIIQGQNWIYGEKQGEAYKFRVAQNLVYNGKNQDLVVGDEDAWARYAGENDKGIMFFVISNTDYHKLLDTPDDPETTDVDESAPTEIDPEDWNPDNAAVEGFTPSWSTDIPAKKDADTYYIYAKAKDGASNFKGGTTLWRGTATIAKANPTFAGEVTNVIDPSWVKTTNNNWRHLWKEIKPNGKDYQVQLLDAEGKVAYYESVPGLKDAENHPQVTYWVQSGGSKRTVEGETVYSFDNGGTITKITATTAIPAGISRIIAQFEGSDNWNAVPAADSKAWTPFEVKYPTVSVQTQVKDGTTATFAYGVDVFAQLEQDYSVADPVWNPKEFPGTYNKPTTINYVWYKDEAKTERADEDELGYYPKGTYYVYAEGDFTVEDDLGEGQVVILPAQVIIAQGEVYAEIGDTTLVYGETLPLTLTYVDGALDPGSKDIDNFNNMIRTKGFFAKMIEDADGNAIENPVLIPLTANVTYTGFGNSVRIVTTDPLNAGKYEVSYAKAEPDAPAKILVAPGTWTIKRKNITNSDFDVFHNPRVSGFNRFNLTMKYAAKQLVPGKDELANKFSYRDRALVYGVDFKVTNPGENINVADGGTFTVEGIGNFTGEKELSFNISKATIYVFAELPKDDEGNEIDHYTWKIGTKEGEFYYKVDWDSKEQMPVADGVTVPKGIKYQLHAFENDRPLANPEIVNADGFKALRARRCVGIRVGYFEEGVETYSVNNEEAANYDFVFDKVPLKIEKGVIKLQFADQTVIYDGENKPGLSKTSFTLANADELIPSLAANWNQVVTIDQSKISLEDTRTREEVYRDYNGDGKVDKDPRFRWPAGEYTIKATIPAETFTATNYDVEVTNKKEGEKYIAALTVAPKPITLTAKNHPGLDDEGKQKYYTIAETLNLGFDQSLKYINTNNVNAAGLITPIDQLDEVVESITLTGKKVCEEGNDIILTPKANKNYTYTVNNGKLFVKPNDELALTSAMDEYWTDEYGDYTDGEPVPGFPYGRDLPAGAKPVVKFAGDNAILEANDGVPYKYVSLKLKPNTLVKGELIYPEYSQWKAGEWHAMVLPFEVTAGDIASQFGYAIINIVDQKATEAAGPNDVHFKLMEITEPIPANTPFCIKSQFDFDYNTTLYFGEHDKALGATSPIVIEYKEKPCETADAFRSYYFRGTYKEEVIDNSRSYLRFLAPGSKWQYIKETSEAKYTIEPYTGFVDLSGEVNEAREINFIFEEEDGSTTAIKAVDFMNGNQNNGDLYNVQGMKVQDAAQKGIYIQNGKKFVK